MAEIFYKVTRIPVCRVESVGTSQLKEMIKFDQSISASVYENEKGTQYSDADMLEIILSCETMNTD